MSASNQGFGSMRHLAHRFFESLRAGGPRPDDDAWARAQLLAAEQALWSRMSGPDRRHGIGVARDAITDLSADGGPPASRPVVAAALLHDVGKVESGLGTWGRAVVTIVCMAAGRARVAAWSPSAEAEPSGPDVGPTQATGPAERRWAGHRARRWRADAGRYVTHDRLGAALLRAAGSDPLTVAWAAEHHLGDTSWSVERRLADALKAADGD